MHYPKWKYHPEKEPRIVQNEQEESALGLNWFNSPADFGLETCPGLTPDPDIAAKKVIAPKKPGRPKRVIEEVMSDGGDAA